jgi:hypothetical protein
MLVERPASRPEKGRGATYFMQSYPFFCLNGNRALKSGEYRLILRGLEQKNKHKK